MSSKNPAARRHITMVLGAVVLLTLDGCATLPSGRNWGQDATFRPGWQRVREASSDAATNPRVWVPLIGAALFQIDGWDRKTSDWARDHTPVFGSQQSAARWSDDLDTASQLAYLTTVVATPGGESAGDWFRAKAKGLGVGLGAIAATAAATGALKAVAGRERPNGQSNESFPSGHASHSAVLTELAARNLRSIDLNDNTRRLLDFGLDALTVSTGWARVEAGAHFPSDTLFSVALGNFFGLLFSDAFLGLQEQPRTALTVTATAAGGVALQWQWRF